jgi:N-methylhydantoinase B
MGVAQSTNALSKMLSCDEELRREAMAAGGSATWPIASLAGIDQRGNPYGTILLGGLSGSIGGFSDHDGIPTGGLIFDPQCKAPNVEFDEMFFPILFLYSRERSDAGGAGRHSGGTSLEQAFVPHDSEAITCSIGASGVVVPPARGLFGGYPGAGNRYRIARGSDIAERLAAGRPPTSIEELGQVEELEPKVQSFPQAAGDVYEIGNCCAAGWGDPLEREPERVATDVARGHLTRDGARRLYGVVVADDGDLDPAATEEERGRLRLERIGGEGGHVERVPAGDGGLRFHEYLEQRAGRIACLSCDADLGPAEDNYKLAAVSRERPAHKVGIPLPPADLWIDGSIVVREFFCPGCATLLDTEVAVEGDDPLFDIRIGAAVQVASTA